MESHSLDQMLKSLSVRIPDKLLKIEFHFDPASHGFPYIPGELEPTLGPPEAGTELRTITVSDDLWDNIIHYADPTRHPGAGNFNRNTLDVAPQDKSEATPASATTDVLAMRWESDEAIVNSKQSSRDVVFEFICRFTRLAILGNQQQRYHNDIPPAANQVIQLDYQSHWRSNLSQHDAENPGITGMAGLADGILECRKVDGRARTNAILMSKPHWGYDRTALDKVFNGRFDWDSDNTASRLMRQFWGAMVANNCKFGILTNGEEVCLAVRTEAPNELVLSQRKNWSDASTAKAIIGLTYAAIDEEGGKWAEKNPRVYIIPDLIGH